MSKGPVQKILLRTTYTNSEGPDEAAHLLSLTKLRAFAVPGGLKLCILRDISPRDA